MMRAPKGWGINLEMQEDDGWISINFPGQPSAADQCKGIEIDAARRKNSQREIELDRREELLKQKEQQVNSKSHELSKMESELEARERKLGLAENLIDTMLED